MIIIKLYRNYWINVVRYCFSAARWRVVQNHKPPLIILTVLAIKPMCYLRYSLRIKNFSSHYRARP